MVVNHMILNDPPFVPVPDTEGPTPSGARAGARAGPASGAFSIRFPIQPLRHRKRHVQ